MTFLNYEIKYINEYLSLKIYYWFKPYKSTYNIRDYYKYNIV